MSKNTFYIRATSVLYSRCKEAAEKEKKTLNSWCIEQLEKASSGVVSDDVWVEDDGQMDIEELL